MQCFSFHEETFSRDMAVISEDCSLLEVSKVIHHTKYVNTGIALSCSLGDSLKCRNEVFTDMFLGFCVMLFAHLIYA